MAPNPIMIPRKPVPKSAPPNQSDSRRTSPGHAKAVVAASVLVLLVATVHWVRRWLLSGAAIETLLIIYANGENDRIFPSVPLWSLLSTLNLVYAVSSTSWLLYALFTAACYPVILLTSLAQFPAVGHVFRRFLRKTLGKDPHFIRDQLALFNLPALEIDTEVNGLFVIRGVTISLSSLTIVAHGIEVGIKITNDIELAICVDDVTVQLFRRIEIGDVFANIKGGKFEMTLGEVDDDPMDDSLSVDSAFLGDTPLLRAATAGSGGFKDRPKLRESLTGGSYMKDTTAQGGYQGVTSLSPADKLADEEYHQRLTEIRTTSAIYQSRQLARKRALEDEEFNLTNDKDMRAAISAELHSLPSIAHPPSRSVRVTTLQTMSPPYMRRFMHRLPFLLRLLLAPLSYFHPISFSSINAAGSGQWVSELLKQEVFKQYIETSAELRRLHRRVSTWLADANFCMQLTDIDALGSVPLSTSYDIVAYLKFNDVMAYRTTQQSGAITQVVRLGGADATFTIPSYLLPHHEHIIPPKPSPTDKEELKIEVIEADGVPQAVQAEDDLKKAQKDESSIGMSVHASLPATFDQTLLNFIAALVKATKIIEIEKEIADVEQRSARSSVSTSVDIDSVPNSPTSDGESSASEASEKAKLGMKDVAGFKMMARNIRQNLKDGSYNTTIKEFAKELHQNTKDGMKKAVVGGLVNDRWIARIVGKTAATLQKAQGDLGYSGGIPIPLAPYRGTEDMPSKLLP
ncbi:putative SMP-LTD domain-containing protein [Seiridium cardinale]